MYQILFFCFKNMHRNKKKNIRNTILPTFLIKYYDFFYKNSNFKKVIMNSLSKMNVLDNH